LDLVGNTIDRAALAAAYAYPAAAPRGWWLRTNMVATVDGEGVAENGLTRDISSDADRDLLNLLRALSDVIIVGSSTAVRENYGPERVRPIDAEFRATAGQPPHPPIALVSSRLIDLDPSKPIFRDAPARTLVFTAASAPADRRAALAEVADVIVAGENRVEPKDVVAALVDRGYRRLLSEGGPRWLGSLLSAGLIDEFCLTMTGRLLGGESPFHIVHGGVVDAPLELAGLLADGSDLYLRYRVLPR
jgi:riboflavin biosynthesis pyrimidine reductase